MNLQKYEKRRGRTREEIIEIAKSIHGDKYDYTNLEFLRDTETLKVYIKIECNIHGEFTQRLDAHITGKCKGCYKCGKTQMGKTVQLGLDKFITKSNKIHNNKYDYSLVEYLGNNTKVKICCPIHGEFEQTPANHLQGSGCPSCGLINSVSNAENAIYEFINIGESIQSDRVILSGKELDIYIPSKNIAIEYNGLYWHGEQRGKGKLYHLNKTEECEKQNIQLIHIFEDEWLTQKQIVKNRLKSLLGKTKYSIFARKCTIKEIDTKLKNTFLDKYHIQGEDKSKIKLGLFYKTRLVAVMTFGKSRFNKNVEWELIRYCTISNFRILGGAGKLLKHFERNFNPVSMISYADRRWSHGNVYKQLGFVHTHNSTPNYFYIKGQFRFSRHQFMKHKLKDKLEIFKPELSEYANMQLNGFDRIFDSGNMVFIKNY